MKFSLPRRFLKSLNPKPALHFLHIGKTGGLNIASNFTRVDERGASNRAPLLRRLFFKRRFVYIRHLDVPWAFQNLPNLIFIIRDPIERLNSAFNYLVHNESERAYNHLNDNEKELIRYFSDFNEIIQAHREQDHMHHELAKAAFETVSGYQHFWMSYEFYFRSPEAVKEAKSRILFIGHINEYNEFENRISLLMGLNIPSRKTNEGKKLKVPLTLENRVYLKLALKSEYLIYDALMKLRE
jgi:hypothetical protein